jgi:hypothetical protein
VPVVENFSSSTLKNKLERFSFKNIITCYGEKSLWLLLQILYFRLQVIYKSYRQVLTPVNNSQLLLKLEILDKLRLVTFHKIQHRETATL